MGTPHGTVTWFGHATVVVETKGGSRLCIDPWVEGNPSFPKGRSLGHCDAILLTHGHADHSSGAVALSSETGAPVYGSVELIHWLSRAGLRNGIGMNKGGGVSVAGAQVTMVNAHHSSSVENGERLEYTGEPAGFVLELETGFTLYDAGDTCLFGDMELIGAIYKPDLAILPIGDHYTMGPREAAHAIRLIGAKRVLPVHYGTFPVLAGTPEELMDRTRDVCGLTIYVLKPGESLEF